MKTQYAELSVLILYFLKTLSVPMYLVSHQRKHRDGRNHVHTAIPKPLVGGETTGLVNHNYKL